MLRSACVLAFFALALADVQHDSLMDLHKATNGAKWTKSDGWGTSADICTWFGVQCTHDPPGTSQIFSVVLTGNNLNGPIPESISAIKTLKVLDLAHNGVTGAVPATLASLPKLQTVHLQYNNLEGELPATMMNLTVDYPPTQEIDLSYNQISGPIPASLFGPEKLEPFAPTNNLKVFNLRYNHLSGDVPTRITRAADLVSFLVGGNNMTGVVPAALDDFLTSRKYCDLAGNAWTCPLPKGIAEKCQAACNQ